MDYDDVMVVATFDVTFMCSVTVCFSSNLSTREDMSKSEKKWTNGLDELRTGHKCLKCCMRHTDRYWILYETDRQTNRQDWPAVRHVGSLGGEAVHVERGGEAFPPRDLPSGMLGRRCRRNAARRDDVILRRFSFSSSITNRGITFKWITW